MLRRNNEDDSKSIEDIYADINSESNGDYEVEKNREFENLFENEDAVNGDFYNDEEDKEYDEKNY